MCASVLCGQARADHLVSAGIAARTEVTSFLSATTLAPSVDYTFTRGPFGVGAGGRLGFPLTAQSPSLVEGYVRAALVGKVEAWEPRVALEFGVTFTWKEAPTPPVDERRAANVVRLAKSEWATAGPLFASVRTDVLRFAFGRFVVSALAFDVGTNLAHPGASLRVGLEVATLGVRL